MHYTLAVNATGSAATASSLARVPSEIWTQIFRFVAAFEPNDARDLKDLRDDIEAGQRKISGAQPVVTQKVDGLSTSSATEVAIVADEDPAVQGAVTKYRRPDTVEPDRYIPAMAVISHVCHDWRKLVLDHSFLWATVRVLHRGLWPCEFMKRSRPPHTQVGARLDIYLNLSNVGNIDETLSLLFDYMPRVESLSLAASARDSGDGKRDPTTLMKRIFNGLEACEAPVLRSVEFTFVDDSVEDSEDAGETIDGDGSGEDGVDKGSEGYVGKERHVDEGEVDDRDGSDNEGGSDDTDDEDGLLLSEVKDWTDVDGDNIIVNERDVALWEAVSPIEIPSSIFKCTPPRYLAELSVVAPLYISPHTSAFSHITILSLFDISEKAFWNVVNNTPLLEELYVEFYNRFKVPAASPLSAENLVKNLVFLPHLRDVRVINARVPVFHRFFLNIFPPDCPPLRRFYFDIKAWHLMGSAEGARLSRILEPMHRENPIDYITVTIYDWGGRFLVTGGSSSEMYDNIWEHPDAVPRGPWPLQFDVETEYTPKCAASWVHLMWPDKLISPSQLTLSLSATDCADLARGRGKFFPSQWVDLARRFPNVEHLKIEDPFILILASLWPEGGDSPHSENDVFLNLKTLTICAEEIPLGWNRYRPPSQRIGLIRRFLKVMGSCPTRRPLERLVFMMCDPAFEEEELGAMKETMEVGSIEMVWMADESEGILRKAL